MSPTGGSGHLRPVLRDLDVERLWAAEHQGQDEPGHAHGAQVVTVAVREGDQLVNTVLSASAED